jgi:hypothetical protein
MDIFLVAYDGVLHSRIHSRCTTAPVSGYLGVQKTHDRLIPRFHWPTAWIDVAHYIRSCDTCQRVKLRMDETPGPHQPSQVAPNAHTIAIDFLGLLSRTPPGKDSVLVIIDISTTHHSRTDSSHHRESSHSSPSRSTRYSPRSRQPICE